MMINKTIQWLILGLILTALVACDDDASNQPSEPEIENLISLTNPYEWKLASTPLAFAESTLSNDLTYGYNRAKLSWYQVDPLFLRDSPLCTDHIRTNEELYKSILVREVYKHWIYPNRSNTYGPPVLLPAMNLAFYPSERGPYNYEVKATSYSAGINSAGHLTEPTSRWGGIMRDISAYTDVKYIEFWLMDPFVDQQTQGGDLHINIGSISEDVLKDDYLAYESKFDCQQQTNKDNINAWGMAPINAQQQAFFTPSIKACQDQGLDGLSDDEERVFHANYLTRAQSHCTHEAFSLIQTDPSADNYHYFRGEDYNAQQLDILQSYKQYNGLDQNSNDNYPSSNHPDHEDLNGDQVLNTMNAYAEIKIPLRSNTLEVDQSFITEKNLVSIEAPVGSSDYITWYHFKIPIDQMSPCGGAFQNIGQFESIRVYLTNFQEPVVLRITEFHLTEE